jgi:predicted aldo/keto reductase-like oxidoreductase
VEHATKKNYGGIPVRPLGNTGLEASIIGLGGAHLAQPQIEQSESLRIIQTAIDEGITFLDNAWDYYEGEAERRMGLGIQGRRDQVVLMTKVCGRDRKTAEDNLHDSLRRLQTDMIDIWQFHEINYDNDPDWIFAAEGALETAVRAREAGKVRFIGFTGHKSPHILLKMLDQDFDWDTCQMPINIMDAHFRSFQHDVLPELNRRGIAALGMKSLGGAAQFIKNAGLSVEQCRRYALSLPISTLISGLVSLDELQQAITLARNFTPLTEGEKAELLEQVRGEATDGRHEWFKTTQYYDSKPHRDQHGFPPIRTAIEE